MGVPGAGLVGGIFDLMEGNPTAPEEHQLGGLTGFENQLGEPLANAGAGFEQDILSGDPTKMATALAPEISSGQGQVEQNLLQNSNFGNRGGGTNASTQNAEAAQRGNIINLEGGLQEKTAGAAVSQGAGFLDQASRNLGTQADLAAANQQRETADVGGIASDIASIAMPFLGGGGAKAPKSIPGVTPGSTAGLVQAGNETPLLTDDELGVDQGFSSQPTQSLIDMLPAI